MDYEDIIDNIGGFGRWQILIFVSICIPDILFAMAMMIPVFIGAEPSWTCSFNSTNGTNLTFSNGSDFNSTAVLDEDDMCSNCEIRRYTGEFTSIVSEWDLVCDRDYVSDVISSIQMSGLLLGAGVIAQTSDTYGRKKNQFATILLLFISGVTSAFAVNWQMFAAIRFLVGVATGGYFCLNCVYPVEFVNRRWRTICGTIGFWAIGQSLLALSAFLVRDWRYLILCTTIPIVVYFVTWCWIPESPRWLAQHDRIKEAKRVFCNIARRNNLPEPDLTCLDKLDMDENIKDQNGKKYSYLDLFKTRRLAKLSLVTMLIWFVLFLTYYELIFHLKHLSGDRYLNVFIGSIMDLSGMIYIIVFNNILGRRICLMIGIIATICVNIALFVIHYLNKEDDIATTRNGIVLLGKGFGVATIYSMQIFSAEIFPTDIRNIGVGAGSVCGRVGSMMGPLLLYAGIHFKLLPYTVMGVLGAVILPMCFFLPETNGKPLIDDFNLFAAEFKQEETDEKKDVKTNLMLTESIKMNGSNSVTENTNL